MAQGQCSPPEVIPVFAVADLMGSPGRNFGGVGHAKLTEQGDKQVDDQGDTPNGPTEGGHGLRAHRQDKPKTSKAARADHQGLHHQMGRQQRALPQVAALGLAKQESGIDGRANRQEKPDPKGNRPYRLSQMRRQYSG